jgi:hypothetical protein
MTSATWSLTGRESLLSLLGKKLKTLRLLTRAVLLLILRMLLVVGGLAFVCAAAYAIALPLGLLTTGMSLLILEWMVKR